MVRASALALTLIAGAAPAAPTRTFPEKVAAAKASIEEVSDEAFVQSWPSFQDSAEKGGLSASLFRSAARWSVMGFELGMCEKYAGSKIMADWYSAFDRLNFGAGSFAEPARDMIRKDGQRSLKEGRSSDAMAGLLDNEKATLCKVEIEAVRQMLSEQ